MNKAELERKLEQARNEAPPNIEGALAGILLGSSLYAASGKPEGIVWIATIPCFSLLFSILYNIGKTLYYEKKLKYF